MKTHRGVSGIRIEPFVTSRGCSKRGDFVWASSKSGRKQAIMMMIAKKNK